MVIQGSLPGDHATEFRQHRPLLFSIAYRMLGSASDAEDVVQDAYLRWERADTTDVRSAKDYLSTTVTRLALDHLRSARVRREVYVGPWLPEPLVGVDEHDPLAATTMAESLSTAFLVLLERLTPTQRAAFLLREVFDFDYAAVARVLETSEPNARQLVQRAKQHIAAGRSRFSSDTKQADELARRFIAASTSGDVNGLLSMLSEDVIAWSDGGGKVAAARRPVIGADRVARFVASIVGKWSASGDVRAAPVNGGVGLIFSRAGRVRAVMTIAADRSGERVGDVFVMRNPDKLGH